MGFELQRKESIAQGAKRLIRKELAQGRCDLKSQEMSVDDRVHEFRRHIKRVRAILRLMRDGLGSKAYRIENHRFSVLARKFSAVRDARACLDAFDSLTTEEPMSDGERNGLRELLQNQLHFDHEQLIVEERYQEASRALRSARRRVADWKIDKSDGEFIKRGFGRVYSAGRQSLQTVKDHPGRLNLHTLRKEATYLRNIVEILVPSRVPRLQEMLVRLKSLTADAGKCLDLQLLRSVILQESVQASDGYATEAIIRRIDNRHEELQAQVVVQAEEIYRRSRTRQLRRMKVRSIRS